jgi:DinB superfamily
MTTDTSTPSFANVEIASHWPYIERTLERMMAIVRECSVEQLNWRPPAEGANSIYALATHTFANARVNVIQVLCGRPIDRDREAEFRSVATEENATIPQWPAIRAELRAAVAALSDADLDRLCEHPARGEVTGREVLMILARHAAEHVGHAELTRDLAIAAGVE